MSSIAENINTVSRRLSQFEAQYGRSNDSVTLLAVSKKQTIEKIVAAHKAGLRHFGESYANEAEDKIAALRALDGFESCCWHFIGPIQSNKTRIISEYFDWIHSVDRLKIAKRLSEQRSSDSEPLKVCIQVNLSGENTKSGVTGENISSLAETIMELPNLELRGLMSIPAPSTNVAEQRRSFALLKQHFEALHTRFPQIDTLSMGMSGDFEAAIAEGSTMVRIGTALFGERTP